jgi:imidazolonepropionase-like amidohydrolase
MAQKLGLALVALLGLANAQIAVARGGVVTLLSAPAVARGGLAHDDGLDNGPQLGDGVVLGQPVVLGEGASYGDHGSNDDPSFGILNFANVVLQSDGAHNGPSKASDVSAHQ